jgi:KEOPS complex subunit Pcc1
MLVLAEFEFDAGKEARIIYEALLPELDQDYQRTRTTLGLKSEVVVIRVQANDIVSMRAALNGWLRLIKITYEMCSFIRDTQVIN